MVFDLNKIYATDESKFNFMKGLIAIIKADGVIEKTETNFFYTLSSELALSPETTTVLETILNNNALDLAIEFKTQDQKMIFLKEGLQLAYIDGIYHEKEKEVIHTIAEKLGITINNLKALEQWTTDGIDWYNKGLKLFNINLF